MPTSLSVLNISPKKSHLKGFPPLLLCYHPRATLSTSLESNTERWTEEKCSSPIEKDSPRHPCWLLYYCCSLSKVKIHSLQSFFECLWVPCCSSASLPFVNAILLIGGWIQLCPGVNTVLPASEYNLLNCPQTGSHTVPPKHSVVCLSKYTARVHNDGSEDSAFKSSQRRRSELFLHWGERSERPPE